MKQTTTAECKTNAIGDESIELCEACEFTSFCIKRSFFCLFSKTVTKQIVVSNRLGLHARPAMQFVDMANQFRSDISVHKDANAETGDEVGDADGKSVMQMIILAATEGTPLQITANGDDAEKAVQKLAELFDSKFGEGE